MVCVERHSYANDMTDLKALSHELASLVQSVAGNVVRLQTRNAPTTGIVWASDGLVVTAEHAVSRESANVALPDGIQTKGSVVGKGGGVALLRVDATGLEPVSFGDPKNAAVGQIVMSVERGERGPRVQVGVLSEIGPGFRSFRGSSFQHYLESSLMPRPGFSGSLLVRADGHVLGMNHAGILRGVPLCIDEGTLNSTVSELLTNGRLKRAYLGVAAHPVALPQAIRGQRNQQRGLILHAIEPNSPAERAGMLLGDVLVELDGQPLETLRELFSALRSASASTLMSFQLLRAGQIASGQVSVQDSRP